MTAALLTRPRQERLTEQSVAARAGRAAAVLALASASVHVLSITTSALGSFVMAAMALACLPCAWHLWRAPTVPVWVLTALLDVGMLAVHGMLVLTAPEHGPGHAGGPGHVHWTDPACLALLLVLGSLVLSASALRRARAGGR